MKIRFARTLLLLLLATIVAVNAQETKYSIGLGGGLSWGINESVERPVAAEFRGFFLHTFNDKVWGEIGLNYIMNEGTNPNLHGWGDYKTSMFILDYRLRYNLLKLGDNFTIFPFAGVGLLTWNASKWDKFIAPNGKESGVSFTIPAGLGFRYQFNSTWALELTGQGNICFVDDLNPPHDEKNDGFWGVMLGVSYTLGPDNDDIDGDGLTNAQEKLLGTDPKNPDTDGDGLTDGQEVNTYKTNPLKADTDGDGLTDGQEILTHKTNALNPDTDGDGLTDGQEINTYKTDALKADTDGDGLTDGQEVLTYKTDPLKADTDGDGLKDGEEVLSYKTNPLKADTDGDGLNDGLEVNTHKTDPSKLDSDGDGLTDGQEVLTYKTNPLNKDTDGGGVDDGTEVSKKQNPLDPTDDFGKKTLGPQKIGTKLVLEGVLFETGKAIITPASDSVLMKAFETLVAYPEMEVLITGHTDNAGKRDKNVKLSLDRANSVKKWLINKGISENRMSTQGFGPDKPITLNDTPENKAKNRRIEFERIK
jgi:outer membrane protein OmpA-like peptidoglycan-associated protein